MPELRKDVYPPGKRPALAGLLPGVQVEGSGRDNHKEMPEVRKGILVFVFPQPLAEELSGMPASRRSSAQK